MKVEALDADDDQRLTAVLHLYRAHADTLGFMPRGGFESRAAAGTLVVAVDDDDGVLGYALYDLPARHVALRHLCVKATAAGSGIGRLLVNEIAKRHGERLGIKLRCRNDFPAMGIWSRLDFAPTNESRGRSHAGHLLTTWWRDFGHPTLFSALEEEFQVRAALDTDVFLDLVEHQRPRESRHLFAPWLHDFVDIVITKEVSIEINNTSDATTRERHRRELSRFKQRDAATSDWEPLAARIRQALAASDRKITPHDERDIRHLARAVACGAHYFLTRDGDFAKRLGPLGMDLEITVSSPAEFIGTMAREAGHLYAPIQLEHTRFSVVPASDCQLNDLVARFVNSAAGERSKHLASELREAIADQDGAEALVIVDDTSVPHVLVVRGVADDVLKLRILRAAGPFASTLSRHIAYLQRRKAVDDGRRLVLVTDQNLPVAVHGALTAEGFTPTSDGWAAAPRSGSVTPPSLAASLGLLPSELLPDNVVAQIGSQSLPTSIAADLERRHTPLKVLDAGIKSYLVPIRHLWAAQLFDAALSEQMLFARDDVLGMSREHVYYSGARRTLELPARLVWYVSGSRPGSKSVRAVSRLEEAVVDRPRTLYRRYQHLGVWQQHEVEGAAHRGRTLALRFSDTELLAHPVALADLRSIAADYCHPLFLRSISEIPEHMFASVYERGTHGSF